MTTISSKLNWIALFTCTLNWVSLPKTVLNTRSTSSQTFIWCGSLERRVSTLQELPILRFGQSQLPKSSTTWGKKKLLAEGIEAFYSKCKQTDRQTANDFQNKCGSIHGVYIHNYIAYILCIYRLSLLVCSGVCFLHNSTVDWLIAPPRGWAQNMKHK